MAGMRGNIIAVKTRSGEVRFVAIASIERIEAFGDYVKIYFGSERVLHRATLSDETLLPLGGHHKRQLMLDLGL